MVLSGICQSKIHIRKDLLVSPINRRISLDISKPLSSLQRPHFPQLRFARCMVVGKIIFTGNGDLARYTSGTACFSKIDISPTQRKETQYWKTKTTYMQVIPERMMSTRDSERNVFWCLNSGHNPENKFSPLMLLSLNIHYWFLTSLSYKFKVMYPLTTLYGVCTCKEMCDLLSRDCHKRPLKIACIMSLGTVTLRPHGSLSVACLWVNHISRDMTTV